VPEISNLTWKLNVLALDDDAKRVTRPVPSLRSNRRVSTELLEVIARIHLQEVAPLILRGVPVKLAIRNIHNSIEAHT
jgi:hypothetical protein